VPFRVNSPHSTYIELALNIGIPGTVLWVLFVLARLIVIVVTVPQLQTHRVASARFAAVIIMILVGSATEAGQMLSTRFALVIMMLALPLDFRRQRPAPSIPARSTGFTGMP